MSRAAAPRIRKRPEERRAEILETASAIAREEGLERVTLRAVADRLGVRPGLISHYFPAAEELVVEAFESAVAAEREHLTSTVGTPIERLARFVAWADGADAARIARLWLNARHLRRFIPRLGDMLEQQETLDRDRLIALIDEGVAAGELTGIDSFDAAVRIWMAVDGKGAYANSPPFSNDAYAHFVADAAAWALRLPPGALRPGALRPGGSADAGAPASTPGGVGDTAAQTATPDASPR
ncbi:TetR/AcrR family transcriptional regulator [Microbacterium sp.]|uniref:TetR/AcrR family transcriptional regulator n=1 Tax=Microbacterium sp. TaxID=51671 RepID=UPI00281110AB|nr:TetR/AcrR family transcriptional regulator [Microbacterium sp.]